MKSQLLAKLAIAYPGLSKHLLGLLADKLALKVTAEDQIEGAIAELKNLPISIEDFSTMLQKEGDRRVTEATAKPKTDNPPKPEPMPNDKGEDQSEISKLTAIVTTLAQNFQKLQSTHTKQSVTEKFNSALAAKKLEIPGVFLKGRIPSTEEELENALTEVETDWASYQQELTNKGLAASTVPGSGTSTDPDKTKVTADIGAWAKSKESQQPAKK